MSDVSPSAGRVEPEAAVAAAFRFPAIDLVVLEQQSTVPKLGERSCFQTIAQLANLTLLLLLILTQGNGFELDKAVGNRRGLGVDDGFERVYSTAA